MSNIEKLKQKLLKRTKKRIRHHENNPPRDPFYYTAYPELLDHVPRYRNAKNTLRNLEKRGIRETKILTPNGWKSLIEEYNKGK